MANISFSQKAATALKIDIKSLESLNTSSSDDWLVTDIWKSKRDPWLFFMHKESMMCFVVKPAKYKINESIEGLLFVIHRYLDDNGLLQKYHYFEKSLKTLNFFKNSDTKATANINARRAEIYYREYNSYDDAHLNYILNIRIHSRFGVAQRNAKEYAIMYEEFNKYLEQVPSHGDSSVKKPDYYFLSRIGSGDYMLPISRTTFRDKLSKIFPHIPEWVEINTLCGIAFGLVIVSEDVHSAIDAAKKVAQDFDGDTICYRNKEIELFLVDSVVSYYHIMTSDLQTMYLIDCYSPNLLSNSSGSSLYHFSLGLYLIIFSLFKFHNIHKNHSLIMARQNSFQKIEDFISGDQNRGNSITHKGYIHDLPIILNDLFRINKLAYLDFIPKIDTVH